MAATTDPNLGLNYGWSARESGWNTGMDSNLKKLGAIVHLSCISILNTPPGSPTNGDRYIVGSSPTGDWAAKANQVAVRVAGAWEYYAPATGWLCYNQDNDKLYAFDAAWNVSGGGDTDLNASPDADHVYSGMKIQMTAGEILAIGDPCKINSAGKMVKATADTLANAGAEFLCLAALGADEVGYFLVGPGTLRDDSLAFGTVGGRVYLSTTGTLVQTAPNSTGNAVQILGVAISATVILWKPELVMVEVA